jgi:hypothetical protein
LISAAVAAGGASISLLVLFHMLFTPFARRFQAHSARWVAFCAGVSIGYVFLYLLPKVALYTDKIVGDADDPAFFPYRLYAIALFGVFAYVLHYQLLTRQGHAAKAAVTTNTVMICVYNMLVGHLIANIQQPVVYVVGTLALALHSMGMNHQMRAWHPRAFDRYIRWLAAAAVLAGWCAGISGYVPDPVIVYTTAFLSGGIITMALSEELPLRANARLLEFGLGVALFCVIAMTIRTAPLV